jgi:hypothetical protein
MIAQARACVVAPEGTAPLEFRDDGVDELLEGSR